MSIPTVPATGPGDAPPAAGPGSPVLPDALWRTTWRRLWGDRGSRTALIAAALLILVALTAPLLSRLGGWSPTDFDPDAIDPVSYTHRSPAATCSPASSTARRSPC